MKQALKQDILFCLGILLILGSHLIDGSYLTPETT